jgi:hypothetical protein
MKYSPLVAAPLTITTGAGCWRQLEKTFPLIPFPICLAKWRNRLRFPIMGLKDKDLFCFMSFYLFRQI